MVFAPKALPVRAAPVLGSNNLPGASLQPGSSLGQGWARPGVTPAPVHRSAPVAPPGLASSSVRSALAGPRAGPSVPASVTSREIGYRVRSHVESMLSAKFVKFDVKSYCVLSVPAGASTEDRRARHEELAMSQHMRQAVAGGAQAFHFADQQPPPPVFQPPSVRSAYLDSNKSVDYFTGLRSQRPAGHVHVYFLKVDALWMGGYAHLHLRVRTVPPERTPLGTPCAIPPVTEHKLVLEGLLTNLTAEDALEPFPATFSRPIDDARDHHVRMRRSGAYV
jgi:hypothetical protein